MDCLLTGNINQPRCCTATSKFQNLFVIIKDWLFKSVLGRSNKKVKCKFRWRECKSSFIEQQWGPFKLCDDRSFNRKKCSLVVSFFRIFISKASCLSVKLRQKVVMIILPSTPNPTSDSLPVTEGKTIFQLQSAEPLLHDLFQSCILHVFQYLALMIK